MNEEQIASALRATIARPQVAPIVSEVVTEAEQHLDKPTNYPDDLAAYRLMDHFEVPVEDRSNRDLKDRLADVYAWARELVGTDSLDVMGKIRELEQRLGVTFRNDDKLNVLWRWIKLDKERRRVEKEMRLL